MNAHALTNLEAALHGAPAESGCPPPLPAHDILVLVDSFHSGDHSFTRVWVRLGELGVSRHIIGAFLHDALERDGGRR